LAFLPFAVLAWAFLDVLAADVLAVDVLDVLAPAFLAAFFAVDAFLAVLAVEACTSRSTSASRAAA
jgi:hypothetical protein